MNKKKIQKHAQKQGLVSLLRSILLVRLGTRTLRVLDRWVRILDEKKVSFVNQMNRNSSYLSIGHHVGKRAVFGPAKMFSVGIVEGFPIFQRPTARETGDFVANLGVDEPGSC